MQAPLQPSQHAPVYDRWFQAADADHDGRVTGKVRNSEAGTVLTWVSCPLPRQGTRLATGDLVATWVSPSLATIHTSHCLVQHLKKSHPGRQRRPFQAPFAP